LVVTGASNAWGIFVAAGRFGRGIEGARILSGRFGFVKGFGELFFVRFAGRDEAALRCAAEDGD
jgi:hypothetical protein